jgi:hypothetical protein
MSSANRKKKLFEVEQELRSEGWFTFHRGNLHGLFHILAFNAQKLLLVQVLRVHKFNFIDVNKELSKVQEFVLDENYPRDAVIELWVWVNHKGWVKYRFDSEGNFRKFDDFANNHFKK